MSSLWHVAYVDPRSEIRVCEDITDELGFEAYAPCERVKKPVRGIPTVIDRPLFPRYIFVGVDPARHHWQRLLEVAGVLGIDGSPGRVPAAWIATIRKMEQCGVFDRTKIEPDNFDIGELVRISDGLFAGFNGTIESFTAKLKSASPRKRVKLLVGICRVEMDVASLEKL